MKTGVDDWDVQGEAVTRGLKGPGRRSRAEEVEASLSNRRGGRGRIKGEEERELSPGQPARAVETGGRYRGNSSAGVCVGGGSGLGSGGAAESMPDSEAAVMREQALVLARDYLQHTLSPSRGQRPPNKAAFTLRKVADQMVEQHQAAFSSMKSRLENGLQFCAVSRSGAAEPERQAAAEDTAAAAASFLQRVVEEMSADEKMNWGRVVSIFAFAGVLCRHLRDSGIDMCPEAGPGPLDTLAECVANYLGKERREWIEQNGGWEGFLRFFSSDDHWQESTVRNMLITVAGFGIAGLACLLAVR
ncbi:bcl-2-like protein 10 [Pristis pectinata]|uniref:bcl-2-like protein 10 n=1 Tax=Pristis pectinata TaxID=685728 RepID=UPI00223D12C7|nr:bcl-2-like protein 10 [Pristis pectinata]